MDFLVQKSSQMMRWLEHVFAKQPSNLGKLIGFIAAFLNFAFIATNKLSKPIDASSFMCVRSVLNVHICSSILTSTGGTFTLNRRYVLLAMSRAIVGTTCAYLFILGLKCLELNHFYSLINTQPIFTFWLGYFFMGEPYSHDRLLCSISAVLGVALIVNPNYLFLDFKDSEEHVEDFYLGITIAIAAGFLKAVIFILIKKLSHENPYKTMIFYEGARVVVPGSVFLYQRDVVRFSSLESITWAFVSGIIELVYQILGLIAMRYERASVIGIIETFSIVLGFVFDIWVLGKPPEIGSVVGTLFIIGASIYLTSLR